MWISSCAAKASRRFASCCARSNARRTSRACQACPIERRTASIHNPDRPIAAPRVQPASAAQSRRARAERLHAARPQVDVVETSRGCTFDCSFCSIIEMRGRNFHAYPIERVLADIARRAQPRRAGDLSRRRQHHARHPALRVAVPRDRRERLQRRRLPRPGDDVAARRARRARWRR